MSKTSAFKAYRPSAQAPVPVPVPVPVPMPVPVPVMPNGFLGPLLPAPKRISPNSSYGYLNGLACLNLELTKLFRGAEKLTITVRTVSANGEYFEISKDNCNNVTFLAAGNVDSAGERAKAVSVCYRLSSSAESPKTIQEMLASELIRGPYRLMQERVFKNVILVEMEAVL